MPMKRTPVVDLSDCLVCDTCLAVCPEVFILNEAGFIEVVELDSYPAECVEEAIRYCPADCIHWNGA